MSLHYHVATLVDAVDSITATSREDLDASYLFVGSVAFGDDALTIKGSAAERANFLRRLAESATAEADRIALEAGDPR